MGFGVGLLTPTLRLSLQRRLGALSMGRPTFTGTTRRERKRRNGLAAKSNGLDPGLGSKRARLSQDLVQLVPEPEPVRFSG